jgi:hypothetical protein
MKNVSDIIECIMIQVGSRLYLESCNKHKPMCTKTQRGRVPSSNIFKYSS